MTRSCPVCHKPMLQDVKDGVTVDSCSCGVWLDKSELFAITEGERHAGGTFQWADLFRAEQRPPVDRSRRLGCPVCAKEMAVEDYLHVHVDWCREHGVWLDAGELEAILNNLRLDPLYVRGVATRLWETRF